MKRGLKRKRENTGNEVSAKRRKLDTDLTNDIDISELYRLGSSPIPGQLWRTIARILYE